MYTDFFFSSRRRHTRFDCDWSSDVCSSDLATRATTCSAAHAGSTRRSPWATCSRRRSRDAAFSAICGTTWRSEEHTSELQSQSNLVCRLLLEKKKDIEALPRCDRTDRDLHR